MATEKLSIKEATALAERWGTTVQTIYSWKKKGVSLDSTAAVIDHIVSKHHSTERQLAAAADAFAAENAKSPKPAGLTPFAQGIVKGLSGNVPPSI